MIANGKNIEINMKTEVDITFNQIPQKSFIEKVFILNDLPCDIDLGLRFMNNNKMQLDLAKKPSYT